MIRRSQTSRDWNGPLKLDSLPDGIEIATLRGDLAKGGGEILLRTPPKYVVPNHSHCGFRSKSARHSDLMSAGNYEVKSAIPI
jgi:hypothetical protein